MVFEAIAELVAERVEKDVSEITPESSFKELGIDSLDTVELLMNLEDKLDMEIELDQKVETVGDLVAFIESKRARSTRLYATCWASGTPSFRAAWPGSPTGNWRQPSLRAAAWASSPPATPRRRPCGSRSRSPSL